MKTVTYEGYLTEQKLGVVLKEIFNEEPITQFKIGSFKVDYYIESIKVAVEFDGYRHYTSPSNAIRDMELLEACEENGIFLVSIPYWVQLDDRVFECLFGDEIYAEYIQDKIELTTSYPHGFIDKKAALPAAYCTLGWERFIEQYCELITAGDMSVCREIYASIGAKIKELSYYEVLPCEPSGFTGEKFLERYPT